MLPSRAANVTAERRALRRAVGDPEVPEVWENNIYVVHVARREDGSVESLSIRDRERSARHDWRDLQRIKNDVAGPETEAVELYPAMSRLMDTANQWWLWVMPPGVALTVGYEKGAVTDVDAAKAFGAKQRPLPPEWQSRTVCPYMTTEEAAEAHALLLAEGMGQ